MYPNFMPVTDPRFEVEIRVVVASRPGSTRKIWSSIEGAVWPSARFAPRLASTLVMYL